jgi:hypothetical protein
MLSFFQQIANKTKPPGIIIPRNSLLLYSMLSFEIQCNITLTLIRIYYSQNFEEVQLKMAWIFVFILDLFLAKYIRMISCKKFLKCCFRQFLDQNVFFVTTSLRTKEAGSYLVIYIKL